MRELTLLLILSLLIVAPAIAQSPTATINGIVLDPSGAAIAGAQVVVVNDATEVQYTTKTNGEGIYVVSNLPPGPYRIQVSNTGFKTIIKPEITLHVQDALAINFTLPIGAASEVVTIQGCAPLINTEDAAVSTVIDRNFAENLPLNGRSFNTLLQLTPGVLIVPTSTTSAYLGQFSINGQRENANSFEVDGVSVNFGVAPSSGLGAVAGGAQAFNVFGGTSSLVSVDALQEFRVETSTYSAEYGRTPGGQVVISTRSGTNDYHGDAFDYFRNDILDANDWISNSKGLPRAAERQNDFGGVLGGPILRDRMFFFLSYEGLRLRQPQSGTSDVPSIAARTSPSASPASKALLNSFPVPNGPVEPKDPNLALFAGNYSNLSSMNATSLRIDHTLNRRLSIFGRYNYAPSNAVVRAAPVLAVNDFIRVDTQTLTFGGVLQLSTHASDNLRVNYSKQDARDSNHLDAFGGAQPLDPGILLPAPLSPASASALVSLRGTMGQYALGKSSDNSETQVSLVDDFALDKGTHQVRFGVDDRSLFLFNGKSPSLFYFFPNVQAVLSNSIPFFFPSNANDANLLFKSLSLYGQDAWKVTGRLTLNYGVRWELSPGPAGRNGFVLRTFENIDNPAALSLAPVGTPLWKTTYGNFAPRVGIAYRITPGGDLALRAGWGIFYDIGSGEVGQVANSFPNLSGSFLQKVPFPIADARTVLPSLPPLPPYSRLFLYDNNLKLPYSQQWSVALEKSFGTAQTISITYLGQGGRRMLFNEQFSAPSPLVAFLEVTRNAGNSSYNALQIAFRRRLSRNLQGIANYSWAHSIDEGSGDFDAGSPTSIAPIQQNRGQSTFDVRHSFSGAVTYAIPAVAKQRLIRVLAENWMVDGVFIARTGFPIDVTTSQLSGLINPLLAAPTRPDLVPGQPIYIADSAAPGGKVLNPAAFSVPNPPRQGDLGRNSIAGFGMWQVDSAVQRKIRFTERVGLQVRADFFNVFNHPNFANPDGNLDDAMFGRSNQTLNRGLGGLSALYQAGGPRSIQLSLKLLF